MTEKLSTVAPTYKLGKLPARPDAIKFAFVDYRHPTAFPPTPAVFGHQDLVHAWGMNGNDEYGCCVPAGAAHETMLWNAEADVTVKITTKDTLEDYAAINGHRYPIKAGGPADAGTDMEVAAKYRRKVGMLDSAGKRHKIGAYLKITTGNLTELLEGAHVFGAVGIGIRFPNYAMDQFNAGQPWDVETTNDDIEGGHYVPIFGRRPNGNLIVVTWGKAQEMTPAFFAKYNDESIAYLSTELLKNGVTLEGINLSQLQADLKAL